MTLFLLLAAHGAVAQPADAVRFLLPVSGSTAGALNSNWRTDISVTNENAEPLVIFGATIPPFTTMPLTSSRLEDFVAIPSALAGGVTISVRVHDTTRDAEGLGVDVPVVPQSQFRRSVILSGVPSDDRYRTLLRIYGDGGGASVLVRIRDAQNGKLLEQATAELTGSSPSFAQIALNTSTSADRILEITTGSHSDPPIWAFVSITNNVTQQVTLATPRVAEPAGTPSSDSPALAAGHWGATGMCMEVTEQAVAVTARCAFGTFPRPVVDADGHFEADGTWLASVGPSPPLPAGEPAHYSGIVQGSKVTLLVQPRTSTLPPVTLELGATTPCPAACP